MPERHLPSSHQLASKPRGGWHFQGPWTMPDCEFIEHSLTQRIMRPARGRADTWVFTCVPTDPDATRFSAWHPSPQPQFAYVAGSAAELADDLWEHYLGLSKRS